MSDWKKEPVILFKLERNGGTLIDRVLNKIPNREFNGGIPNRFSAVNFISTKTGFNVTVPPVPFEIVLQPGDKITITMEKI